MDSIEVTLFFDQPKVSALQSILAEDGTTLAVLDFNVDEGTVTACEQGQDRGRCYSLHDVSVAAYKAFRGEYRTSAREPRCLQMRWAARKSI